MRVDQEDVEASRELLFDRLEEFEKGWAKAPQSLQKILLKRVIRKVVTQTDGIKIIYRLRDGIDEKRNQGLALGNHQKNGNVIELASGFREKGSLGNSRDLKVLGSLKVRNGRANSATHHQPQPIDRISLFNLSYQGIFAKAAPLYESGLTLREISRELGIPKTTIRQTLIEGGFVLRAPNKKQVKSAPTTSRFHTGVAPYGHCIIRGKLVPHPKEQEVIKTILSLRAKGQTLMAIADELNNRKIKPRSAPKWDHSTIRSILNRHKDKH